MWIQEHCSDRGATKIDRTITVVALTVIKAGGEERCNRRERHGGSCFLSFHPLSCSGTGLHWLEGLTLPSPLHDPAVAPLTCSMRGQKPVGGLDGLCRLRREQLHHPQLFLVLTHNKQILSPSVPTSLNPTRPACLNLHLLSFNIPTKVKHILSLTGKPIPEK